MKHLRLTPDQLRQIQNRQQRPVADKAAKPAKPAKYGNVREGGYDSRKEAARYQELQMLERAGKIRNLRRQVPYAIVIDGEHVCNYVADHVYEEGARTVVEDTKSAATRKLPVYRLKRALMRALLKIEISEV